MNLGKFKTIFMPLTAITAIGVMAICLGTLSYPNRSHKTLAGQIIDGYGTFRSPNGQGIAIFEAVGSNESSVTVAADTPTRTPSGRLSFNRSSPWFAAWDDQDRLWTYIEGLGVHVQDIVHGTSSTTKAGEFGGWAGIPSEFLQRLPEPEVQKYQQATKSRSSG